MTQIGSQVNQNITKNIMKGSPKKEFLEGDEKRLISEVKNCYGEKNEIEIIFSDRGIPIEKGGYINLTIVKEELQHEKENEVLDKAKFTDKRTTSFDDIYGTKTSIELKDILGGGKSEQRIFNSALLLGRAGIGKSTVCHYIAYQWSVEQLWNDRFDLVLWIPLRNLQDKNKYGMGKINSYRVIYEECFSQAFKDKNKFDSKIFFECFKKISEDKILYVLDGYDEIVYLEEDTPERKIINEVFLKKKNIILTSRPFYLNKNLFLHKENAQYQRIESIGFLDKDIENYINLFFKEVDSKEKSIKDDKRKIYSDSLKQFFKEAPNAKGIAHIPINLALICQAWEEHYEEIKEIKNKHYTLSMLYQGLLQSLCIRYLKRHEPEEKISTKSWQFISTKGRCPKILDGLKAVAFGQMSQESLVIENQKVMEIIKEKNDENLLDDLINFGLLKPVNRYHIEKEKQSYYFIHLTFQEFLAAYYIVDKLREEANKVKNKDEYANENVDIKKFIKKNKYHPRYEIVWWFVAGLLKEKQNEQARELFFECLEDKESRDIARLSHQCLLIRCFDECGEVESESFIKRKEDFIAQLCLQINFCIKNRLSKETEEVSSNIVENSNIIFSYLGISPYIFNEDMLNSELTHLLIDDRFYCYSVLLTLGRNTFLPEKILRNILKFLDFRNNYDKSADYLFVLRFRIAAERILARQSFLPQKIFDDLVTLLDNNNSQVSRSAASILSRQYSLSENIVKKVAELLQINAESLKKNDARSIIRTTDIPAVEANVGLILNLANQLMKNKNLSECSELMEKIVLNSFSEKTPIYKDLENKKNIFVGVTKVEFETSAQRNQFIKDFQKRLVEVTGVKVIQTKESKVSEFFGGFFNLRHTSTAKLNEKEVVDDKDENTEDRDACLVM